MQPVLRSLTILWAAAGIATGCVSQEATAVEGAAACVGTGCSASGGTGGTSGRDGGGAPLDAGSDVTYAIPIYTLVVDTPENRSSVSGIVTVTGLAPGFLNVEVWDAEHQHPPLTQTDPRPDGTFQTTVDTTSLEPGLTSWTVFAWDSPPNQPFEHSASVTLRLEIR